MLDSLEVTVEDWSDPRTSKYGLKATTRFGLGILRSNVVSGVLPKTIKMSSIYVM
jgi:hypothetical protein